MATRPGLSVAGRAARGVRLCCGAGEAQPRPAPRPGRFGWRWAARRGWICLEKDPADRPASATELLAALRTALEQSMVRGTGSASAPAPRSSVSAVGGEARRDAAAGDHQRTLPLEDAADKTAPPPATGRTARGRRTSGAFGGCRDATAAAAPAGSLRRAQTATRSGGRTSGRGPTPAPGGRRTVRGCPGCTAPPRPGRGR